MKYFINITALLFTLSLLSFTAKASDDLEDIETKAMALEIYLKDKKDYQAHCTDLEWDQPSIEVYKSALKTQLPEACIQRINK